MKHQNTYYYYSRLNICLNISSLFLCTVLLFSNSSKRFWPRTGGNQSLALVLNLFHRSARPARNTTFRALFPNLTLQTPSPTAPSCPALDTANCCCKARARRPLPPSRRVASAQPSQRSSVLLHSCEGPLDRPNCPASPLVHLRSSHPFCL